MTSERFSTTKICMCDDNIGRVLRLFIFRDAKIHQERKHRRVFKYQHNQYCHTCEDQAEVRLIGRNIGMCASLYENKQ